MSAEPEATPPQADVPPADAEQPVCAAELSGDYDLHWHIGAMFLIMLLSFMGTLLPIVGRRFSAAKLGNLSFQCLKLFGSGVILATAVVHMFTPAQEQLTNPCLPQVFQDYGAWAGAIALFGIFFTHFLQVSAVTILRQRHGKKHATKAVHAAHTHRHHHHEMRAEQAHGDNDSGSVSTSTEGPLSLSTGKQLEEGLVQDKDRINGEGASSSTDAEPHVVHRHSQAHADDAHHHSLVLADAEKTVATYVLELGIASHSIIIGLTLGAAREEFHSLLIALCFHQFFEGLALSTVVLDAELKKRTLAIGMVIFYCFTTPIGIALGIALNSSYNENATRALISTGVLDALSAGILLYDGLANIIVPHFQSMNFKHARISAQFVQFLSLWAGAALMAVIGRWA
ncbi:Zinc/iron permease [Fimicolochytrium jonesii]|uniref:Zinc/iron permease n=1 Tax=Fimicolochytrium jonesii TaxID=1396493 RepID=UPI0022FEA045|nr:Zinc/iron permease [Fimicolochytrium jonesii]KAI8818679.1 Zinc/iron permease [Fimicolochytrium jonesii]